MIYTEPILFSSVVKDLPARKLADNILQQGDNIIFDNTMITPRYGIANMCSTSLGDEITGISLYKKLRQAERYIIVMTNKDIYVYNPSRGIYQLKTRNYLLFLLRLLLRVSFCSVVYSSSISSTVS